MLPVYQAFDRVKFSEVPTDDARTLEDKLERASRAFADRGAARGLLPKLCPT